MKTRTLGKGGLSVSALGLGCMGMSWSYYPLPEAELRGDDHLRPHRRHGLADEEHHVSGMVGIRPETGGRWAVTILAAQGRRAEAIAYAVRCRSPWASDTDIDGLCEQILVASGELEEAYAHCAVSANRAATYLGWFRAVAKKYPDKPSAVVLAGTSFVTCRVTRAKWFAATKDAKLFDETVALANATPWVWRALSIDWRAGSSRDVPTRSHDAAWLTSKVHPHRPHIARQ